MYVLQRCPLLLETDRQTGNIHTDIVQAETEIGVIFDLQSAVARSTKNYGKPSVLKMI